MGQETVRTCTEHITWVNVAHFVVWSFWCHASAQQAPERGASGWWKHKTTTSLSVFKGAGRRRSNLLLIESVVTLASWTSPLSPSDTLSLISLSSKVCFCMCVCRSLRKNGCLEVWNKTQGSGGFFVLYCSGVYVCVCTREVVQH